MTHMTLTDVAEVLRNTDVTKLTTPAQQDDLFVMLDYLKKTTLEALDEAAQRTTALDLREAELAKREAVLATRQAAVDRILSNHGMVQPAPKRTSRWF